MDKIKLIKNHFFMLNYKLIKVFLFVMLLVIFFDLEILAIRNQIHDINIFILSYLFLISYKFKNNIWFKYINYYCVFVLLSCIYSWYFNHQPFWDVLRVTYPYLGLLSFFLCLKEKMNSSETLTLILAISYFFCFCYILQWILYPNVIFHGVDEFTNNQYRARMACSLCCFILIFFGINRYLLNNKKKELFVTILGFLPAVIMGFRSVLASIVLFIILMVIHITKHTKGISLKLIFLLIFGFILYQTPIAQEKMGDMKERNETDNFNNEDYVRYASFFYYELEFQENIIERIIGGGIPLVDIEKGPLSPNNQYQLKVSNANDMGLFWNDLGVIGLSNMIGIPAIILLIIMVILTFKECRDHNLQFIRFMLTAILLASIMTSQEIYRHGNFVIIGILFYYVYVFNQEKIIGI